LLALDGAARLAPFQVEAGARFAQDAGDGQAPGFRVGRRRDQIARAVGAQAGQTRTLLQAAPSPPPPVKSRADRRRRRRSSVAAWRRRSLSAAAAALTANKGTVEIGHRRRREIAQAIREEQDRIGRACGRNAAMLVPPS
jgi:hypothetical protein